MRRKKLIAFTGIDGSGKTTQARLLVQELRSHKINASYIRCKWEPFLLRPLIHRWKGRISKKTSATDQRGNNISCNKQKMLQNPVLSFLWLGAFFVDYGFQITAKIKMRLLNNGVIISDRIFYDSIIDQAVNLGGTGNKLLNKLDSVWLKILFPKPDIVIFIDLPEHIAFVRKNDEYTPNIEYLTHRRKLYLELADKYKWIRIDGKLPVDEIAALIRDTVYEKVGI